MNNFFETKLGKAVEAALWQMAVIMIGIGTVAAAEGNAAWLVPFIPVMMWATKFINTTYIKK